MMLPLKNFDDLASCPLPAFFPVAAHFNAELDQIVKYYSRFATFWPRSPCDGDLRLDPAQHRVQRAGDYWIVLDLHAAVELPRTTEGGDAEP